MLTDELKREIESHIHEPQHRAAACTEALRIVQRDRGWIDDDSIREILELAGGMQDGVSLRGIIPGGASTAVGRQHIFGSEELSSKSPPIAQLTPAPYVLMHPLDATALGLAAGDSAEVHVDGAAALRVRVAFGPAICRGLIALPQGLPGAPFIALPAHADVRKGAPVP